MNYSLMLPELILLLTAVFVLLLDVFGAKPVLAFVAVSGTLASLIASFFLHGTSDSLLGGRFVVDSLTMNFKSILLLAGSLTILMSGVPFSSQAKHRLHSQGEYLSILLFTLSGMLFLTSSRDLISLYVSLELATLPLFALTAWEKTKISGEGAMKYLLMGALASAFLLYGFGLLFGLTGSTAFSEIASHLKTGPLFVFALALLTAGVGFKLTLAPFHFWAPDAYEAAPTPITAFLSVASKATGLILAFHIYIQIFGKFLSGWGYPIALIATLTMTIGNVVAILQHRLKRFMAFSSISQAGYLILGFLGQRDQDLAAMSFYLLVYVLTNLTAFGVLTLHLHQTEEDDIRSLRGFSRRNPILSLCLMLALFGLAGIPPLSGFVGKFFLFSTAAHAGYYGLVAIAALNSTVSLYYYLRLVRQMYIEAPDQNATPLHTPPEMALGIGIATVGSVICGLIPHFYEGMTQFAAEWLKFL